MAPTLRSPAPGSGPDGDATSSMRGWRIAATVASLVAIAGGGAGYLRWMLEGSGLEGGPAGTDSMAASSGLCFLLVGTSLYLCLDGAGERGVRGWRRLAALGAAGIATLVALLRLGESLPGWPGRIDDLLVRGASAAARGPGPGRMAAATAVGLLLVGLAVLLLDADGRLGAHPSQYLAVAAGLLGLIVVEGYLFRVPALYEASVAAPVSWSAATLLVILGGGALFARPGHGLMATITRGGASGVMARRLLPVIVGAPLVLAWACLRGQRAGLYGPELGLALFATSVIVVLGAVVWSTARSVGRLDAARGRAELEARHAAEQLGRAGLALENAWDPVIGLDLEGRITSWNPAAARLYGHEAHEALGRHAGDLLVPDMNAAGRAELMRLVRSEEQSTQETLHRTRAGAVLDVEVSLAPIRDEAGRLVGQLLISRDVTARKRSEQALHDEKERFRQVVESASNGVLMVDRRGTIVLVNREVERAFGYPREELVGAPIERLLPGAVRPRHEGLRQAYLARPTARRMGEGRDLHGQHRDGRTIPIEVGLTPIELEGETFILATVVDITVRKNMEAVLVEQAQVLDLAQVLVRDMDDRIVLWNRGAEALYGFTRDEALGQVAHELLRTRLPEPREAIAARLLAAGTWEGELVHYRRDGSAVVVASTWALHRDPTGQPLRILEASTDITARKEAEDQMRLAQARLHTALEGGGMGTWIWDIPGGTVWWDEPLMKLLGRAPAETMAGDLQDFLQYLHPDDRTRVSTALESTVREETRYDIEYRTVRPDGEILWIAARGRLDHDGQGRPWRMTGVCVDITARKRAEAALYQAQKMEALGTLAGGIAHDFNNILSAILGNVGIAMEALPADHAVQSSLTRIDRASVRAVELVRRILTFSRRGEATRKVVRLRPIIEEALQLLRATIPAMVEIRPHLTADVPGVLADPTAIHQILMNLGTNAAHAMGSQGGVLEVRLEAVRVDLELARVSTDLRIGDYARISVSDNGSGMDAATVVRIFDPFFTTKPLGEGTGLGLSVVHGLMRSHDGAVTVYSEPGRGTIFRLYFPVAETPTEPVPPPPAAEILRGDGRHVLYVDDEEDLVLLAKSMLERLGYRVTATTNPSEALQRFRETPATFDAVITDLAMPGRSGLDLIRELREVRPDVPIVLSSGYFSPQDTTVAERLGVSALVVKPNTAQELISTLHHIFARSGSPGP